MNFLVKKTWNPYLTGALIGVLAVSTFYFVDKPMGFAKAFAQVTVIIEKIIAPEYVENSNIQQALPVRAGGLEMNWHLMLFIGVFIGAFISSKLSGEFKVETVPIVWKKRYGDSKIRRLITAYAGGILLFTGTWIAGGCTMSHGINGSMQLALSGWVFFMVVFAAGIITAMIMYRSVQ
jgi:hypothetical protein